MNMHISFFAYLDNMKTEIYFSFIRCQFFQPKLSQSRNMNVLLCMCVVKIEDKSLADMETEMSSLLFVKSKLKIRH